MRFPVCLLTLSAAALAATAPAAQALTAEEARTLVAPFYSALNPAPGKDVAALVTQVTSADWQSCGGNEACSPREKVIGSLEGFGRAVPNLKWELKEVLVAGDRIVVRGEASGTPVGTFMGVPHGGRSFRIMSIDVHTVRDGKLVRAYHVEDWMGAVRQLAAP